MKTLLSVASLAVAASLSAPPALADQGTPPSVIAMNQKVSSNAVSITYANLPAKGSIAIFEIDPHGRRHQIGRLELAAGDHRDVKVTLKETPKAGTRLEAVLEHSGKKMKPFKDNAGQPAEQSFKVL